MTAYKSSIPAEENGPPVVCKTKSGMEYVISLRRPQNIFTLWRHDEKGYLKIESSKDNKKLNAMIPWEK